MKIDDMDLNLIDRSLDEDGYLLVKDPEVLSICTKARLEYQRALATCRLHPTREVFDFRSLAKEPWRKLAIGSHTGLGEAYAQNLQSTYFDADDANFPFLGSLFKVMIRIRNRLMRVSSDFGRNPGEDRFWNACRIHHYPRGGGFMALHKDTYFPKVIDAQIGKPFYQVSALLSRKHFDFFSGGGCVIDGHGKKIDLEVVAGFGSLVIFDGRIKHGVEDVDLDQLIDFSRPDGRLAAFVNLYSVR